MSPIFIIFFAVYQVGLGCYGGCGYPNKCHGTCFHPNPGLGHNGLKCEPGPCCGDQYSLIGSQSGYAPGSSPIYGGAPSPPTYGPGPTHPPIYAHAPEQICRPAPLQQICGAPATPQMYSPQMCDAAHDLPQMCYPAALPPQMCILANDPPQMYSPPSLRPQIYGPAPEPPQIYNPASVASSNCNPAQSVPNCYAPQYISCPKVSHSTVSPLPQFTVIDKCPQKTYAIPSQVIAEDDELSALSQHHLPSHFTSCKVPTEYAPVQQSGDPSHYSNAVSICSPPQPEPPQLCAKHYVVRKIKPVYDEYICKVPIIQNVIKHQPVTTIKTISAIKRKVTMQPEHALCHIPGERSCRPRTKPCKATRLVPMLQTVLVRVPVTERVRKHAVHPATRPCIKLRPVVQEVLVKVPIKQKSYRPVIVQRIVRVPVKTSVRKDFVETKVAKKYVPCECTCE